MRKEIIGINAGIVWRIISAKGYKMSFKELLMETELNPIELASAIGWLAREDNIIFIQENGKDYFTVYRECYY